MDYDSVIELLAQLPIGVLFALVALFAIALNRKTTHKIIICLCYVAALCLEEGVYQLFTRFGIMEDYWKFYYQSLSFVDLLTLIVMYEFLHADYKAILYIVCLMVAVNVLVLIEPLTIGTVFVWEIRIQTLEILNYALLLVMFGRSDGFIRVLDKLYAPGVGKSMVRVFRSYDPVLHVGKSEESLQKGRESCTTR